MTAVLRVADRVAGVQRSRRALSVLGIALVVVLVASVVMVLELFTGHYTSFVTLRAEIAGNGNAVGKGNDVVYRDVTIGTVASSGKLLADHDVVVELHIRPGELAAVPANVSATVEPVTIFGTEYVVLQLPAKAKPSAAHLVADQLIPPAAAVNGANVQGAVSSLDQILNALHPAQLDTALTAVATALNGQGRGLGRTLVTVDGYLKELLPHLPELEDDLQLLAPVADQVAASTPALVGALSNLTVTANTITSHQAEVHQILVGGATVSKQIGQVLAKAKDPLIAVLKAAGPFLHDLSLTPTEQRDILDGLGTWAKAWSSAESSGPYLQFSASVNLANATDLVFAALNAPGTAGANGLGAKALGTGSVDPPTYTAADCPTYGSQRGRCSSSSAASTSAASSSAASTSSAVSSRSATRIEPAITTHAEEAAIASLVRTLDRGRSGASPAVSTLLVGPILGSLAVQS